MIVLEAAEAVARLLPEAAAIMETRSGVAIQERKAKAFACDYWMASPLKFLASRNNSGKGADSILSPAALAVCCKTQGCHSERSEESRVFNDQKILRFAQDDKKPVFSANC